MCGLAGAAWTTDGPPLGRDVLVLMADVLVHRGPDASGYYLSHEPAAGHVPTADGGPGAALAHRRLSIIDLAGGAQPLSNEDGTVWVVFNGEIYNYRELQAGLERRGHRFRTSSDTEVIVHAYEEYGPACVEHFRGMFAFALWDHRRRALLLARDRLGKKPLVYRQEPRRLLFASELKAILQVPDVPRRVAPRALDEYLAYQYVPHPHSILEGFTKLPPAHWALYTDGRLQVVKYWEPAFSKEQPPSRGPHPDEPPSAATHRGPPPSSDPVACRRQLRELLTEAVRLRLRSDVPLGAFLSGGLDSTIITGLMQENSSRPVQTFSIGFPVKSFDERSYARAAAEHLKTEHHEFVVEPRGLDVLPQLAWHYDEPFADSSAIPSLFLAALTRRHVTVALSGDGGDELFAGYDRYAAVQLAGYIDRGPYLLRRLLASPLWQRLPARTEQGSRRRRFKRLISVLAHDPQHRYYDWVSIFNDARRAELYTPEFRRTLGDADPAAFLTAAYEACPDRDFVTRTTCTDVLTYLPCDILTKVDIATMACGLEARAPFLDHHVVDFAARLPIQAKLRGRIGKRILRETFADLLPPAIQTRAKMGFGVPLDHWFRGELRPLLTDVLLDPRTLARGYFDPAAVRRLIDDHVAARWDHSARLWALLVLELWHRTWLDPAVPPSAGPPMHLGDAM